jgi:hypothetical protein
MVARVAPDTRRAVDASKARGRRGKTKGQAYPSFIREDDVLVKIGFSRKSGATYEHRAPKRAVDAVVKRVTAVSQTSRGPFSAEALSDLHNHQDEQKLPGYQLYLCLAWLKSAGLIKQHGRKGYSIADAENFDKRVEEAWSSLETDE